MVLDTKMNENYYVLLDDENKEVFRISKSNNLEKIINYLEMEIVNLEVK